MRKSSEYKSTEPLHVNSCDCQHLFGKNVGSFREKGRVDYHIIYIIEGTLFLREKGEEIAHRLVSTSPRGCTIIDTVGAYTHENNKMLVCALKDNELPAFQHKILEIDPHAFIIFSESSQIVGNGFHVYR